ncbi:MAG: SPOR domain-containing protein [Woeseiaceae bacterium]|nr:SPOR domain-containing protein [Woeseiaceae bacterium]
MRNLLLLLILANILYFLYGAIRGDDPKPGVDIVKESQLGPRIEVAERREAVEDPVNSDIVLASSDESADPVLPDDASGAGPSNADGGETESVVDEDSERASMALTAVVGRSCVSVGPFSNREDGDRAQMQYAGEGMEASLRRTIGQIFVGHWVQIRNIASREEAAGMLDKLHSSGLGEAYLISTEDEGLKISIGLFGEAAGAERVELQATSLGLNAEIAPRTTEGTVYYVDIGLPPGRGAGSIIDKYGEDKVLLREEAACPGSS